MVAGGLVEILHAGVVVATHAQRLREVQADRALRAWVARRAWDATAGLTVTRLADGGGVVSFAQSSEPSRGSSRVPAGEQETRSQSCQDVPAASRSCPDRMLSQRWLAAYHALPRHSAYESKSREKLSRSAALTCQAFAETGALAWMLQYGPMLAITWPPPVITS